MINMFQKKANNWWNQYQIYSDNKIIINWIHNKKKYKMKFRIIRIIKRINPRFHKEEKSILR